MPARPLPSAYSPSLPLPHTLSRLPSALPAFLLPFLATYCQDLAIPLPSCQTTTSKGDSAASGEGIWRERQTGGRASIGVLYAAE